MKIGDKVRSLDFAGREDCYVEGVLVGYDTKNFDCPRYSIRVEKVVWENMEESKPRLAGQIVHPPVNGTPSWDGEECNFVRVIESV